MAIVAAVLLLLRHVVDWLPYVLGAVVAVLLSLIAPQVGYPGDGALVVVILGAALF